MGINNCPKCGAGMRYIKAGVSKKTGKEYPAFYACDSCKNKESSSGWRQDVKEDKFKKVVDLLEHIGEGVDFIVEEILAKKEKKS